MPNSHSNRLLWIALCCGLLFPSPALFGQLTLEPMVGRPTALDLATDAEQELRQQASQLRLAIEQELQRQRQAGYGERATRLETELQALYQQFLSGNRKDSPETELHVIAVEHGRGRQFNNPSLSAEEVIAWQELGLFLWYRIPESAGLTHQQLIGTIAQADRFEPVELYVGPTSKSAYLYLAGANALHWHIRLHPQAKLLGVFLSGFDEQKVSGLPENIPVHSDVGGMNSDVLLLRQLFVDVDSPQQVRQRIQREVGLPMTTYQGFRVAPVEPIPVGSRTPEQELAQFVEGLAQFQAVVNRLRYVEVPDALSQVEFEFIEYQSAGGEYDVALEQSRIRKAVGMGLVAKPVLEWGFDYSAVTSHGAQRYGLYCPNYQRATILRIPAQGEPSEYRSFAQANLQGLAWDSKRERLIGFNQGELIVCPPGDARCQPLGPYLFPAFAFCALEYDPHSDLLCGLDNSGEDPKVVYFDPQTGGQKESLSLQGLSEKSLWRLETQRQLRLTRHHILLLLCDRREREARNVVYPTRAYVFDRETGNLCWQGQLRGPCAQPPLSQLELAQLWARLPHVSEAKREEIFQKLLASQPRLVPFLKSQFPAFRTPSASEVQQLIEQLEAESFADREAAQRQLARQMNLIQPRIRSALKTATTVETRTRLSQLLREVEALVSSSPQVQQEYWAIQLLSRCRSAEAIQFVEQLAIASPGSARSIAARHALKTLDESRDELSESDLEDIQHGLQNPLGGGFF